MTESTAHQEMTDAHLALAVLAARADEAGVPAEAEELEQLASNLAAELPGEVDSAHMADYAEALSAPERRHGAYATALAVCRADGKLSKRERAFLRELGGALGLSRDERRALRQDADALVGTSRRASEASINEEVDDIVRNAALLAGALELLPQTIGTIGIVGLQVRMVKRIAKQYGKDPSTAKAREFLATVGVGLAGQALEIHVRRAAKHLHKQGFLGRLAGHLAGPGFTFATTYALGELAQRYYSGGQSLDREELRGTFTDLYESAKRLAVESDDAIRSRAAGLGIGDLVGLLRR